MSEDEALRIALRMAEGVQSFADEMRDKGIHVGLGSNPRCVTCGERWPCSASQGKKAGHEGEQGE